jgi:acyl-CoA dehydrogenase
MQELHNFREQTRAWLLANCPPEMRLPMRSEEDICWGGRRWTFHSNGQRIWLERMAAKGWTVPQWPKKYGGGGLSWEDTVVLRQEMRLLGCRSPLEGPGIWVLGPTLLKYGSEAQKLELLPKIARGEIRWCQGYSEPAAGSDLASVQTRAEDHGDHLVVNGQKIWTSHADEADWIFCLVRTDPKEPRHMGLSFLLFDMKTTGVSTKPIALISGKSPFCQTFFDNVLVPKSNVVGGINHGWEVAKYLLTHERETVGSFIGTAREGRFPEQLALESIGIRSDGTLADSMLRAQIASFQADVVAFKLTVTRFADLSKSGQAHPALSSVLKYYGSEINKRRLELLMTAGGSKAAELKGHDSDDLCLARTWLRSKANSIEGGTNEIQLNIIVKRILNLPTA